MSTTRRNFLKGAAASIGCAATIGATSIAGADEASADDLMTPEIAQRKWGFEVAPDPVSDDEIAQTYEADVVVVGAGTAGIICANSCIDNGLNTILFSASSVPCSRGGSNCCAYSRAMKDAGLERMPVFEVQKEILANYNAVDQKKWYLWYNTCEEAFDWVSDIMEERGYFTALEQSNYLKEDSIYFSYPASHSWLPDISSDKASQNQEALVNELVGRFQEEGGTVVWRNAGYQLVRDEESGRVTAVIARDLENGGYNKYVGNKAIVIAAGDFSADREMMLKYAPEYASMISDDIYDSEQNYDLQMAVGGLYKGDMHKAALWIGAAWQKTLPNCPMVGTFSGGATVNRYQNFFGLLLDADGERFMNEYASRSLGPMTQAMQKNGRTWAIWDSDWANRFDWYDTAYAYQYREESKRSPEDVIATWEAEVEAGNYIKAETIEELLELSGLPASAVETVNHYNELCANGSDTDFYKDPDFLIPIQTPPFYCQIVDHYPVRFYTILGGLRTNVHMQVCDENDEAIPGLYNVGTGVGDMFAGKYTFMMQGANYGINCITFPYLTGKYIAENE